MLAHPDNADVKRYADRNAAQYEKDMAAMKARSDIKRKAFASRKSKSGNPSGMLIRDTEKRFKACLPSDTPPETCG